jgi:hypothetical protein
MTRLKRRLSAAFLAAAFAAAAPGAAQVFERPAALAAPAALPEVLPSLSGLAPAALTVLAAPPALPAAALTAAPAAAATAPSPAGTRTRLEALGRALAPELESAGRLSAAGPESAAGLGRSANDKLLGFSSAALPDDTPVPAAANAAAAPAARRFGVLRRLGLDERILRGGGLRRRPDGALAPLQKPLSLRVFDNDDNLIYYRTKIYVRSKSTGEEKAIPTAEFARVRPDIGLRGPYRDDELFGLHDADGGSFRDFLDVKDPEIFAKDMQDALKRQDRPWRGPSWRPFRDALADARDADWVAIVTSRAHRSSSFVDAFGILRRRGELARVPRAELIFGVGELSDVQRALPAGMKTPERKIEILIELLDLLNSVPLRRAADVHSFSYSDDDLDMITRVRDRLAAEQASGRWPRVRVSVFSTAAGHSWETVLAAPARAE